MPQIDIIDTPHAFAVRFRYDRTLVEAIKTISGRRWDAASKTWAIPKTEAHALKRFVERYGGDTPTGDPVPLPQQDPATVTPSCAKGPPHWAHQLAGLRAIWNGQAGLVDLAMGAGKSRILVDYCLNREGVRRVLIVCPRSVVGVWEGQFQRYGGAPVVMALLDERAGTVVEKQRKAHLCVLDAASRNLTAVVVINYDSVWREPFADWAIGAGFDVVAADECQRLASPGSKVSRYMYRLGRNVAVRLGLSGTPIQDAPLGVYGLYRYLDPAIFGTNFHRFKETYCLMGGYGSYKIVKYINQDQMRAKMNTIRFHMDPEGLDLPEAVHMDVPLQLPPALRKTYKALERDFYAEVDQGIVSASNAGVKIVRLQQLTSGYAVSERLGEEDGTPGVTELQTLHTLKQDALQDLLEDLPPTEPVVVFCRFRYDLDQIAAAAQAAGRLSLELSGRERSRQVQLDQGRWLPHSGKETVLAVQIRAGSIGVDLTCAAHAVYFSYTYSLADYDQSLARVHRPGQTRRVVYHHLVMEGTIDDTMRQALSQKRQVLDVLLADRRDQ